MKTILQNIHPIFFLIVATTLEVSGDAIIRRTIYDYTGAARIGFGLIGVLLLFGYGFFLNLAPVEFEKVVGLYIATLFIVWQIISYHSEPIGSWYLDKGIFWSREQCHAC
jgi:hypothetical protein